MSLAQDWQQRIAGDLVRAASTQTPEQRYVADELVCRARAAGASAVVLTGSTARRRRTPISDLDYHVIGPRFEFADLTPELDVVTDGEERFFERLRSGDDFAQWSVRFGCVLIDDEQVLREGAELIERYRLWPDAGERIERSLVLADLAEKVLAIGDEDAGQEHVRAALTAAARGILLEDRIFPLARAELPAQLCIVGEEKLASALELSIHADLQLTESSGYVELVRQRASHLSPDPETTPPTSRCELGVSRS
jgi:hypothetical protein